MFLKYTPKNLYWEMVFSAFLIFKSKYQSSWKNSQEVLSPTVSNIQQRLKFSCKNKYFHLVRMQICSQFQQIVNFYEYKDISK